ncbi:complement component receptor 1-like protein isoform X2 [Mobula hypostoma]|uniref:complement component receptor 1-like protein isoform X2 n=1 Tax=Mobula hypostoma TaxID=723540 RepID=UPI002FC2F5DC
MKPFLVALLLFAFVGGSQADSCGTPPALENGDYSVPSYSVGSWTHYTCNEGYILYGRNRRLCTKNGWTRGDMSCQIRKCDHPPTISHGTVTEGEEWLYGYMANYSCDEGHSLTGQETIRCTGTGAWSHPPPNCTGPITVYSRTENTELLSDPDPSNSLDQKSNPSLIQKHEMKGTSAWATVRKCDHPPTISHGTVTEGEEWLYEAEANYLCDEGYTLTGQETIYCTDTGEWSHPPPICTVRKCDHPPTISHGTVTEGEEWLYGYMANYSCDEGHSLTGQETIRCTGTGAWSHPPPNCTGPITVYSRTENTELLSDPDLSNSLDQKSNPSLIQKHEMKGTSAWATDPITFKNE